MLVAIGDYVPEGPLLGEAEAEKEREKSDHFPAYATDEPVIADHMALALVLHTQRPDIGATRRKYNVYSLTAMEWEWRNREIREDQKYTTLVGEMRVQKGSMDPAKAYRGLSAILRTHFRDKHAKQRKNENRPTSE